MTLEELKQKIFEENFTFEDFDSYYKNLSRENSEFLKLLEDACEIKKDDKKLYGLLIKLKSKSSSELIDKLKKIGNSIRNSQNSHIKDAFTNLGYRLLEQTRAGKRDDVYYGFLRNYISAKEKFPLELVEVFKPYYSDEMFKVFIFTFLSGVIGQEEQTSNKE